MDVLGIAPHAWFPVVTLVVGAVLKACFDSLSDRRASFRERAAREEQRRDMLRLRRAEFQRSTLLELQDAIWQLTRFAGRAHHEDQVTYLQAGRWKSGPLSEEVDQGYMMASAGVARLNVRVRNDNIRKAVNELSLRCVGIVMADSPDTADAAFRSLANDVPNVHELIGGELRSLDEEEQQIVR